MIGEKTISPVEVVQKRLARIEEVNGALNAFCFTYPEEAWLRRGRPNALSWQASRLGRCTACRSPSRI